MKFSMIGLCEKSHYSMELVELKRQGFKCGYSRVVSMQLTGKEETRAV
jgi:hypothetical protein